MRISLPLVLGSSTLIALLGVIVAMNWDAISWEKFYSGNSTSSSENGESKEHAPAEEIPNRARNTSSTSESKTPGSLIAPARRLPKRLSKAYMPRKPMDTGGYLLVTTTMPPWKADASLEEISRAWDRIGYRHVAAIDQNLARPEVSDKERCGLILTKVGLLNYEGEPKQAYQTIEQLRSILENDDELAHEALYSMIVLQGVTALRIGENENCILCRGESSCILPISPAAVHTNPQGSRLAISHFMEYLEEFPEDLEIRWLLNLAHMTLGEHPDKVDSRFLISLDHFNASEHGIGKFRDVGDLVGLNRLNQAGGGILEDFDNDGHFDAVTTTFDPTSNMAFFHNTGNGKFVEQAEAVGLKGQFGGLNCVQTDYNNDGFMDVLVVRGAWLLNPMRPSLLSNNQNGTFTDVTQEAGLLTAVNSISASWNDYDHDGWLDLYICCEQQPSRLYRNLGNGKFEEVAEMAGLPMKQIGCKGSAWIDYDNDGWQDLFLNYYVDGNHARLLRNNKNGTFRDVTKELGIAGPAWGFSCWAWDYDNDGWQDIFATTYERSLGDVVLGLMGQPHSRGTNRLYRNKQGQGFEDVTKEAGLDDCYSTMGSNFGDFDNDGFLDMYLATGEPNLAMLVPNRMLRNLGGKRFVDITASSGTGNLQKGHGVACGDWDRDGDTDIFVEMGGVINGDKYHNILFQNPGHGNHFLTLKLVGTKSNKAAIGARIKIVTAGPEPQTIHRHVSTGSSFGASPLQQAIGIGKADRISLLEIHWPVSDTKQVFKDIAADQALEITEQAEKYRQLNYHPVELPKE